MIKDRIGETRIAKNGLKMTIIEYRSAKDLDIEFEDGTVVTNKHYSCFENGNIKNPNINIYLKKIGEINTANNGQKMTIIAYRNYNDIDIQLENGIILKNKTYRSFKNGVITNRKQDNSNRIGETNIANNGQKMTIIKYKNVHDIDIQFEDGTIVKNRNYKNFKNGGIKNPNLISNKIGETNVNSQGHKMKIIAYRNCYDIDIEFEDGTIVTNKHYSCFKNGNIENPNKPRVKIIDRTGEIKIARNGMKMTIIAYRGCNDIDVEFEDGTIITNTKYQLFKNRTIKNPNINKLKIGEQNKAKNGQMITIIDYFGSDNITIQFEDGTIVTNKTYQAFKKGTIQHPNIHWKQNICKNEYIGQTNIATNGQKMTIISYRSARDLDIQFEDGTVVTNKTFGCFKKGHIKNPNKLYVRKPNNYRIGEISVANNGMKMTIIDYRGAKDIDIQFEDGTIVKNKAYHSFKKGNIENPNPNLLKYKVGDSKMAKNGLKMTIIAYRNCYDIDIQFEDGYIINFITAARWKLKTIKHPFPYQMDNILLERKAYLYNGIGNFYCSCSKCGHRDIWTIEEAKNHKCEEIKK